MRFEAGVAWGPMFEEDLVEVDRVGTSLHPGLHESRDTLAARLASFRAGCHVLRDGDAVRGYGFAFPWTLGVVPPLDASPPRPEVPDCLFVHDVAVLPSHRGRNASEWLFWTLLAVAEGWRLPSMACVAVYGTERLWTRFGFVDGTTGAMSDALRPYGAEARYLTRSLST